MKKIFEIPWGSESICSWCKKEDKCRWYTEDSEVQLLSPHLPIRIHPTDLRKIAQITSCPINEFILKPPEEAIFNYQGCEVVLRGSNIYA